MPRIDHLPRLFKSLLMLLYFAPITVAAQTTAADKITGTWLEGISK